MYTQNHNQVTDTCGAAINKYKTMRPKGVKSQVKELFNARGQCVIKKDLFAVVTLLSERMEGTLTEHS